MCDVFQLSLMLVDNAADFIHILSSSSERSQKRSGKRKIPNNTHKVFLFFFFSSSEWVFSSQSISISQCPVRIVCAANITDAQNSKALKTKNIQSIGRIICIIQPRIQRLLNFTPTNCLSSVISNSRQHLVSRTFSFRKPI